jgi:hypothetical protein
MIEVTTKSLRLDYTRSKGLNHPEYQHCLDEVDQSRMTMHTTWQCNILIEVKCSRCFHLQTRILLRMTQSGKPVPQLSDEKWAMALAFPVAVTTQEKVKCTLLQALRLCRGRTAHRGRSPTLF